MTFDLTAFLPRAVMQGIPLLYGSTGEILTEKSGNLNLGIPGVMYVGGICGVIGAFFYEQSTPAADMNAFLAIGIPMLCSLLGSLLMGLLYCLLTVTLRANQNVTGLALTTFGVGIGNFFGGSLIKLTDSEVPSIALSATSAYFSKSLNVGGWFGQVFLSYGFLAYLAIVIALFASYFLKHTRTGLHLRAVGESAATADAAGINVTKYKYLATCIGSMIAGLGGLYYVMDYACGVWSNNAFGDRGWLAIALVIFTIWRPNISVFASFLFGGLYILYLYLHPLYFHPHRHQPCHQGALQDAPLRRHAGRSDHRVAAQEARGSAARIAGSELLPRREIKNLQKRQPNRLPFLSRIALRSAHTPQARTLAPRKVFFATYTPRQKTIKFICAVRGAK